jgi:hypothetical protein
MNRKTPADEFFGFGDAVIAPIDRLAAWRKSDALTAIQREDVKECLVELQMQFEDLAFAYRAIVWSNLARASSAHDALEALGDRDNADKGQELKALTALNRYRELTQPVGNAVVLLMQHAFMEQALAAVSTLLDCSKEGKGSFFRQHIAGLKACLPGFAQSADALDYLNNVTRPIANALKHGGWMIPLSRVTSEVVTATFGHISCVMADLERALIRKYGQ